MKSKHAFLLAVLILLFLFFVYSGPGLPRIDCGPRYERTIIREVPGRWQGPVYPERHHEKYCR